MIPTAFSVIAIKQYTVCARQEASEAQSASEWRCYSIGLVSMEAGIQETASYMVSRCGHTSRPRPSHYSPCRTNNETKWSRRASHGYDNGGATVEWASSLARTILSLFTCRESIQQLQDRLAIMIGDGTGIRNNATLAVVLLALRCGEMIHPFTVFR